LAELYGKSDKQSKMDDHDSTLYVYTSGLLMKPVNPLDKDIWLRIQDMEFCSSVKAYADPTHCGLMFVPTDSQAGRHTPHPSIFAVVMKRTMGGIKISDCHAFVCGSDQAAMALVRACAQAFGDKRGWASERPSLIELGLEQPEVKLDNECYVDDAKEDCTVEFYDKPSLSGFFYAPRSDLIQKYSIRGEDNYGRPIGQQTIESFMCDQPQPQQCQITQIAGPVMCPEMMYPSCGGGMQPIKMGGAQMGGYQSIMPPPVRGPEMDVGSDFVVNVPKNGRGRGGDPVYMTSLPHVY